MKMDFDPERSGLQGPEDYSPLGVAHISLCRKRTDFGGGGSVCLVY